VEPGREDSAHVDLVGAVTAPSRSVQTTLDVPSASSLPLKSPVAAMASKLRGRSPTPHGIPLSTHSTQGQAPQSQTGSVFALPYRMLFAIATMDTITVHDTQQAGPICFFTKLHYDEFTDMS